MIIYTQHITPRIQYIFEYVIAGRLGLELHLETDLDSFKNESGFKLNYSNQTIKGIFQVIPNGLLTETTINASKPDINYADKSVHFYATETGNLHFDVFSACFWMLSRYEEYQDFEPDLHGRFLSTQSYLSKYELLLHPIVDEWMVELKTKLSEFYPDIRFKIEDYNVLPTIDIDSPWCYRNKGLARNIGGFIRDCIKSNFSEIPERLMVLSRLKPDAHFQFNWLNILYKKLNLKPIYFILVGKYGKYDKTISQNNNAFKSFLKSICAENEIGIHPSYSASKNKQIMKYEHDYLSSFMSDELRKSRQHFLKFELPYYYLMLNELGVKEDYSMGFADAAGFRAGTSKPFYFFDLKNNKATDLMVYPFSIMDVSVAQYQNKTSAEALSIIKELVKNIKQVNGDFVSLWHNESLSERMEWKGWRTVYEEMLYLALE